MTLLGFPLPYPLSQALSNSPLNTHPQPFMDLGALRSPRKLFSWRSTRSNSIRRSDEQTPTTAAQAVTVSAARGPDKADSTSWSYLFSANIILTLLCLEEQVEVSKVMSSEAQTSSSS